MDKNKKKILDFIKRHMLCVVATAGDKDTPEAAVVEFGETQKLELIFDTFSNSRKVANIVHNPNVAVVIGWDEEKTVQYEGKATKLVGEELVRYKEDYFSKNPKAKKWEDREGIIFFKIKPRWIRYSNLSSDPWEIFEVTF